jgi:hypothetical protein
VILKEFVLSFPLDRLSPFWQTDPNKLKSGQMSCRNGSLHPARGAALLRVDSRAGGRVRRKSERPNKERTGIMKRQEIIFSPSRLRLLALCFRPKRELPLPRTQATAETAQVTLFSRTNGLLKTCVRNSERVVGGTATMLHHQLRAAAEPVAEALD